MVKKWLFISHKFSAFFLPKLKKMETEKLGFYVVAFDLIKIQTPLAPQNDRQDFSFVKDIYVVGKTMTINAGKMANTKLCGTL